MKTTLSSFLVLLVCAGCTTTRPKAPEVALGPNSEPTSALTITGRDRGKYVVLQPKGVLTVALEASEGYHWKLVSPLDENILKRQTPREIPPPAIALPPANTVLPPTPQQWVFKAVGPGVVKVRMIYTRLNAPLDDTVSYNFTVNAL